MSKVKQTYKPYSGIGSRSTPPEVLEQMTAIATQLESLGFSLRTGGALGADTAFLNGIQTNPEAVELYLPWQGYNDYESPHHHVPIESIHLASMHHPNWSVCKDSVRKLHGRNCNIILGPDVRQPTESLFVICYTEGAKAKGGTGLAISVADSALIPIFDFGLGIEYTLNHFQQWFEQQGFK